MRPAGKPITVPPHIIRVGSIRYSSRTDYHVFCDNREHFKLCSVFRGSFNWLPGHLFLFNLVELQDKHLHYSQGARIHRDLERTWLPRLSKSPHLK